VTAAKRQTAQTQLSDKNAIFENSFNPAKKPYAATVNKPEGENPSGRP